MPGAPGQNPDFPAPGQQGLDHGPTDKAGGPGDQGFRHADCDP